MFTFTCLGSETDKEQEGGNKKGKIKAASKMMVIGHRGSGMNLLQSSNKSMKFIKENSLVALNAAGNFNLHFIEFDVQVIEFFFC